MLDYQFLGAVAVILAVATRGALLPVVAVTAFIGLATVAGEAVAKWYRRRHPRTPARLSRSGVGGRELNRWMAAVERILRSAD